MVNLYGNGRMSNDACKMPARKADVPIIALRNRFVKEYSSVFAKNIRMRIPFGHCLIRMCKKSRLAVFTYPHPLPEGKGVLHVMTGLDSWPKRTSGIRQYNVVNAYPIARISSDGLGAMLRVGLSGRRRRLRGHGLATAPVDDRHVPRYVSAAFREGWRPRTAYAHSGG
jgi:hypothetical protein